MVDIAFSIHGPGGWIDLEDLEGGYEVHKDTRATQSVTFRKQEISSPYVEGTFTNEAVRENVTEPLVIYVYGDSAFELDARVSAVTDALEQLQYEIKAQIGNLEETWTCSTADYAVETSQEFIHATMALIRAQVPRLPTVVKAEVV